jgi:hypothetical protein
MTVPIGPGVLGVDRFINSALAEVQEFVETGRKGRTKKEAAE